MTPTEFFDRITPELFNTVLSQNVVEPKVHSALISHPTYVNVNFLKKYRSPQKLYIRTLPNYPNVYHGFPLQLKKKRQISPSHPK